MTSNGDVRYDDPQQSEGFREISDRKLASRYRARSSSRELDVEEPDRDPQGYQSEGDGRVYSFRRTITRGSGRELALRRQSQDGPVIRQQQTSGGRFEHLDDRDISPDRERGTRRRYHSRSRQRGFSRENDESDNMRKRREGNILERNFDSSYDGIIAGVAGAAVGAMTARHFAGRESRNWKILGGAVAGAAATNAAENWYRVHAEEKEERRTRRRNEDF